MATQSDQWVLSMDMLGRSGKSLKTYYRCSKHGFIGSQTIEFIFRGKKSHLNSCFCLYCLVECLLQQATDKKIGTVYAIKRKKK